MSENPGGRSRTTWSLGFPLQVHCRNFRISRTGECSGHLGRWWICCVPLVSCVSRLQIQPFRNHPKHQNCTFKIDLQLIENSFGINMDREFLEWNNPFSHSSHSSQASLLSTTGGATSKSHLCFRHPRKRLDWLDMRNPNAFQDAGKMRKCCCWSFFQKSHHGCFDYFEAWRVSSTMAQMLRIK